MMGIKRQQGRVAVVALGAVVIASACSHVKRDELHTELDRVRAELRQELQDGDAAVARQLGERIDGTDARLAALEQDLGALREEFRVTVERLESAIRFNVPVHFAFDDATVRPQDRPVLDRFASVVRQYYPDALITVEGFTDPAGSRDYNQRLGMRRAESVMDYLVSAGGVPANRLRAVSYGADTARQVIPGAQGPGEMGWQNRRVTLVVEFNAGVVPVPTERPVAGLTGD